MDKYLIYFLNILIISFPLAIFEIIVEKTQGWGRGWQITKWYARPFYPDSRTIKILVRALKIESPLNYHMLVFALIIPSIFVAEYFYLTTNVLLLISCFICVLVTEDFFWFLLNWNFDSLSQLLKGPGGTVWWHKDWVKISSSKYLPASYFYALPLSLILLLLA